MYVVKLQEKKPQMKDEKQSAEPIGQEEHEPQMEKEEFVYAIYDNEQNLIATVGQDGKIQFTGQYKNSLKEKTKNSPGLYERLNLEENEFNLPEELAEDDMVLTEDDLAKFEEEQVDQNGNKKSGEKTQKENDEQEEKDINTETEEQRKEKIAKVLGIKPEEVKGFAQIDPNKKITEDSRLCDIMPEAKNYDRIEIACAKGEQNQGDGKFCILGIEKDGTRQILDSVESIEGVSTNKKVISINENGDKIQENAVQGLMRINAKEHEDGIAFSLGDYGMLDISYVRDVMNQETRRSTPIDTLELENRKNLSAEVRENAADDIQEVREESQNFRKKEEQGKEKQNLEDIDKQRNENIEVAKSRIAEDTAELINEGATNQQVRNFISQELDKIPSVNFNNKEKAYVMSQIESEALDLSRFPTRMPRK